MPEIEDDIIAPLFTTFQPKRRRSQRERERPPQSNAIKSIDFHLLVVHDENRGRILGTLHICSESGVYIEMLPFLQWQTDLHYFGSVDMKLLLIKDRGIDVESLLFLQWRNDLHKWRPDDDSFENIFSRQLQANGKKGDILIGLSTSGNSININNAAYYAKKSGIKVITLTGNDGGKLKSISDLNINVDSKSTQRIQEMHILIGHIICDLIERNYIS